MGVWFFKILHLSKQAMKQPWRLKRNSDLVEWKRGSKQCLMLPGNEKINYVALRIRYMKIAPIYSLHIILVNRFALLPQLCFNRIQKRHQGKTIEKDIRLDYSFRSTTFTCFSVTKMFISNEYKRVEPVKSIEFSLGVVLLSVRKSY